MGKRKFNKDIADERLLEWQRFLEPNSSEKRYTLKQLHNKTDKEIAQCLSFIKNTRKLMKSETDIGSFFTHLSAVQQNYCRIEILNTFQKNSYSQKGIARDYKFLKKQTDLLLKDFIYNSCIQQIKLNLEKRADETAVVCNQKISFDSNFKIPANLDKWNLLEIPANVRLNLLNLWFVQISEHFNEMSEETIKITCVLSGILDDI